MKKTVLALLTALTLVTPAWADIDRLSINEADESDLMELAGEVISRELARRIVDYRETNGPFRTVDDLRKVPELNPLLLDVLQLQELDGDLVYESDSYVTMPTY